MKRIGQGGFATLEVILMVTVIGILASIAVPRFNDITTRANTAKIQSDLTTIDTAIAVYNMRTGSNPASIDTLMTAKDLQEKPTPPRGKVYLADGTIATIDKDAAYSLNNDKDRAVLNAKTAGDYYYDSSKTYSEPSGGTSSGT